MSLEKPDYVLPMKMESPEAGGDEYNEIPTELDPREDGVLAREFAIPLDGQHPKTSVIQQRVGVDQVTKDIVIEDTNAGPITLTDLKMGEHALVGERILQKLTLLDDAALVTYVAVHMELCLYLAPDSERELIYYNALVDKWFQLGQSILVTHGKGTGPTGTYLETFEAGTGEWLLTSADGTASWEEVMGATPSNNTGPSGAHDGSYYVYTEVSGNTTGGIFIMETTNFKRCQSIDFYYHMFGAGTGSLSLEVYNGVAWTRIWTVSGQQHTAMADAYTHTGVIDLTAYVIDKIRIVGEGSQTYTGDTAVDSITIVSGE